MEKSVDAFRTISEVADDLALPQHVLRFWETRFSQIKPMKRGGGRRYYRPEDVDLLRGIRALLYEQGYTIKGVQKLLRQNGSGLVMTVGRGDLTALQTLVATSSRDAGRETGADEPSSSASTSLSPEAPHAGAPASAQSGQENMLLGQPRGPVARRLFGLAGGAGDEKAPAARDGPSSDDRALLQEVLYDLLECKRLLEQGRQT